MIDFNDTAAPAENTRRVVSDAEREALRAELLARRGSAVRSKNVPASTHLGRAGRMNSG